MFILYDNWIDTECEFLFKKNLTKLDTAALIFKSYWMVSGGYQVG